LIGQLQTQRLLLRPPNPADAPAIQRFAGDERIARWTARIPHPYPEGAAEGWIAETREQSARGDGWQLAVTRRPDGALVGAVGLERDEDGISAELGYWIAVPFWGLGYATEAARRIIRFGFQETDIRNIHANALTENAASRRVLEKAGLGYVGQATITLELRGRDAEVACYALARAEWLAP
jgi:RimJ/RimL family protein N-acetyltransferase